jgi:hypothetical protein
MSTFAHRGAFSLKRKLAYFMTRQTAIRPFLEQLTWYDSAVEQKRLSNDISGDNSRTIFSRLHHTDTVTEEAQSCGAYN